MKATFRYTFTDRYHGALAVYMYRIADIGSLLVATRTPGVESQSWTMTPFGGSQNDTVWKSL